MKSIFSFILVVSSMNVFAQKGKSVRGKHYFSLQPEVVAPLGVLDDIYYGGYGISGIMHFKWLQKGAEVQLIVGFDQFKPKRGNPFGDISVIPFKAGLLQMISKEFYLYGRLGALAVKDSRTAYSIRLSTDAGLGFAFKTFAADIGFHGWDRKNGGGFTNYFSAGIVLPFKRTLN